VAGTQVTQRSEPRRASARLRRELFNGRSISFLLSQIGAHSSRAWAERLGSRGLTSREVMLFWNVARAEGRSQRQLADALGLQGSRVVGLVDGLEERGWLERRTNSRDRRARALHLTDSGRRMLDQVMDAALDQELQLSRGLTADERETLVKLLGEVARAQGLTSGVHPDF
jgi:DNA-binding MarR family transcriptional regulator